MAASCRNFNRGLTGGALPGYPRRAPLEPASPPPALPRLRALLRIVRRVAAALLVLVLLLVAGTLVYARDLDSKVRLTLLEQLAEVSAHLGRRIDVGEVRVTVGLIPEIVVHDFVIGPAEGAQGELAVPVLRVPAVRLAVALGPLIRSGDSAIEVTRLEVVGPEVTLVRTPEGLSIDDIRARLAAAPRKPPPATRPHLALRSLAMTGGKVRLHRLGGDADGDVTLDQIALTGRDLTLAAPSHLSFAVAVLAPAPNVTVEVDLAPSSTGPGLELTRADFHAGPLHPGLASRWGAVPAGSGGRRDRRRRDAPARPGRWLAGDHRARSRSPGCASRGARSRRSRSAPTPRWMPRRTRWRCPRSRWRSARSPRTAP